MENTETKTFADLELDGVILEGISVMGYNTPTPIQEAAIPHILHGSDLIACAQTGTGKTAAYLLPLMQNILLEQ
jgi:superfamily II DNA/RNA helicase